MADYDHEAFFQWVVKKWRAAGHGKWSLRAFGLKVDAGKSTVGNWFDGTNPPRRNFCVNIAEVLNVHPDEVRARVGYYVSEERLRELREQGKL